VEVAEFKILSHNLPGGTGKNRQKHSHDSRSPKRDLNPGSPEYKGGVLIAGPRRSVGCWRKLYIENVYNLYSSSSVIPGIITIINAQKRNE
jgi:hypothetical protein